MLTMLSVSQAHTEFGSVIHTKAVVLARLKVGKVYCTYKQGSVFVRLTISKAHCQQGLLLYQQDSVSARLTGIKAHYSQSSQLTRLNNQWLIITKAHCQQGSLLARFSIAKLILARLRISKLILARLSISEAHYQRGSL